MFSSFDVHIIVEELKSEYDIIGMKVDKVYKIGDEIRIKLYGKGRKDLILKPGKAMFATAYPKMAPQKPSGFAMQLRKYLGGLRIMDIEQIGFDRLARLSFGLYGGEDKEDVIKYYLILEMFGDGNLILTDHEDSIIGVLHAQNWSTRSLKAKETYEPPPAMMSPYNADMSELVDSDYEIVKLIATKMNIGGMYAEEICLRGGVNKKDTQPDIIKVENGINALINLPKSPAVVNGKIVPFDLMINAGKKRQEFKSLNEAADEVYGKKEMEEIATKQVSKKEKQMDRLDRILRSQIETVDNYSKKAEKGQMMGDLIFENYQTIEMLLTTLHKAVKSLGWKEVNKRLKESDDNISKTIKSTSPKTGKLVMALEGGDVELDITKNVNENAQRYYETSKKMKHKIVGATKAIEITKAKIEKMKISEVKVEEVKKRVKKKKEWYERYRWFMTSDGYLVIGGKDARTNETIVKKHLEERDIHVHADIQGAPQVIVKNGGEAPERTIEEAGIFAVSFSKAWKMGVSGLNAYWVNPDQVTKDAPSGEFLAKGAFFIKGKKNFLRRMPLDLGIGIYKGKIMCGPNEAVKNNCEKGLKIIFGSSSKEAVAKRIRDIFEWEDLDDIIQSLPSGNCEIKEN